VDLTSFSPNFYNQELRESLVKGAKYLLVHCGRLSPEKQPQRSFEAVAELQKRGIDVHLVYVGGGPLWSKLRQNSKGLPVTFLGYIADRKRVAEILASADISLAPGPIETFCLAALESLASGTPVVASETSAVGEFLLIDQSDSVGAVAANNGIAFANAIENFIQKIEVEPDLNQRCHEQSENYPWSSTISLMLTLHGDRPQIMQAKHRLRAA
jgi:alpha-1,6-mannosyltransferase